MSDRTILWIVFNAVIFIFLAIDLRVGSHHKKAMTVREATVWSIVWIVLSFAFAGFVWAELGRHKAVEYVTGYLLEKALSVDNMFVFIMVFAYFGVPAAHQPRVLKWGILGALIMRGALIAVGATLIARFHWILLFFAVLLIWAAYTMLTHGDEQIDPEKNPVLKLFRRFFPVKDKLEEDHFFTRVGGKRYATSLLVVLLVIETTDLVFALDSIPAIFGITKDPFIVYTSNVFAILGLRALFFVLAGVMDMFRFLKVGVSVVLFFIGAKMLVEVGSEYVLGHDRALEIPVYVSLGVVIALLAGSIVLSLAIKPRAAGPPPAPAPVPPPELASVGGKAGEGGGTP